MKYVMSRVITFFSAILLSFSASAGHHGKDIVMSRLKTDHSTP